MGERNVRVMESECKGVEVGDVKGVGVWLVNTVAHLMRVRPSVCACVGVCVWCLAPRLCLHLTFNLNSIQLMLHKCFKF